MDINKRYLGKLSSKVELKPIEIEIIKLMAEEYNSKAIASKLKISFKTVTGIRERLLIKTKSINGIGIIIWSIKNEIIKI